MKKIKFQVNEKIFPLEAVLTASYSFVDSYYLYIDKNGNNFSVSLEPKSETDLETRDIEGQFRNELLHSALRVQISRNNSEIRQYIIGQALSSALPVGAGGNEIIAKANYADDPLGIAIPWEEKFNGQESSDKAKKSPVKTKKNAKSKKNPKKSKKRKK
jgi:His-Xaa-Ser system protein HxsD